MNPGLLDEEIVILQRETTLDSSRSPVHRWVPLIPCLPVQRVVTARAEEVYLEDSVRSRVSEVFKSHFLDRAQDLGGREDCDLRIEFDEGAYEVIGIVEDARSARRQAILIMCSRLSGRIHNPI